MNDGKSFVAIPWSRINCVVPGETEKQETMVAQVIRVTWETLQLGEHKTGAKNVKSEKVTYTILSIKIGRQFVTSTNS